MHAATITNAHIHACSRTQASLIYVKTNFPGVGFGIQFAVKQVTVYTSASDTNNPYRLYTTTSSADFLNILTLGERL